MRGMIVDENTSSNIRSLFRAVRAVSKRFLRRDGIYFVRLNFVRIQIILDP